nr:hypothetical protein P9270_027940 [Mesorhizobium sp. WSM4875]
MNWQTPRPVPGEASPDDATLSAPRLPDWAFFYQMPCLMRDGVKMVERDYRPIAARAAAPLLEVDRVQNSALQSRT